MYMICEVDYVFCIFIHCCGGFKLSFIFGHYGIVTWNIGVSSIFYV